MVYKIKYDDNQLCTSVSEMDIVSKVLNAGLKIDKETTDAAF